MPNLSNGCDGSNGTTVTTSNTGGPNQFDSISRGASSTVAFDTTTKLFGTSAIHCAVNPAASEAAYFRYSTSLAGSYDNIYVRLYLYISSYPSTELRVHNAVDSGGATLRLAYTINSTGKLECRNAAYTVSATSTTSVPQNQWVRIETDSVGNATTGSITCRLYSDPNSATPTETVSASSQNTGGQLAQTWIGLSGSAAGSEIWLDEVAVSTSAQPGPIITTPLQQLYPVTDVTTTSWTKVPSGAASFAATIDEVAADDSDYAESSTNPSALVLEVALTAVSNLNDDTNHTLYYRLQSVDAATSTVVAGVYQGTSLIASWQETNVPATATAYSHTLTSGQAAAITDYSDLRARFTVTAP